jgi:TolB protein
VPTQEILTATPEISRLQQARTPIPTESVLYGNIAFLTDREGNGTPQIWVMNPSGVVLGKLSSDEYYKIAETHALFSPGELFQVDVGLGDKSQWQIVILDVAKGTLAPLIPGKGQKGSYQPAWSPLGDKIVYVSDWEGTEELYVYDISTKVSTRITTTPLNQKTFERAQNNHPSWSPDGKHIVFASNRDPFPRWQIWIIEPNGADMHRLATSPFNDTAPNWVR